MFKVSKNVEYSLALIRFLSLKQDKVVSVSVIIKSLNLPSRFVARLASDLANAKVLFSKEGKGGGYSLEAGWQEKSLYDVVVALGEDKRLVDCLDPNCSCPRESGCKIKSLWKGLEEGIIRELKSIKLKEL